MSSNKELNIGLKYQQLFDAFYTKVVKDTEKLLTIGFVVTKANVLLIMDLAMKQVGKLKTITGFEKKALVVATINKMMEDTLNRIKDQINSWDTTHKEDWENLQAFVDKTIDPFIDQLYALAPKVYGKVTHNKFWSCIGGKCVCNTC